jgi:hypothetical protein
MEGRVVYLVWDAESGRIVSQYRGAAEAFAAARRLVRRAPAAVAEALAVGYECGCGHPHALACGRDLDPGRGAGRPPDC